jgi:hypothetical protein
LLSENVHKDSELNSWIGPINDNQLLPTNGPQTSNGSNPEQRFGMIWVVDNNSPGQPLPANFQPISRDTRPPAEEGVDYGNPSSAQPYAFARPASVHPEVFLVAFCDGRGVEIRGDIEYRVYQQLMTPNGPKVAEADAPNVFLEPNIGFMVPPMGDGDY